MILRSHLIFTQLAREFEMGKFKWYEKRLAAVCASSNERHFATPFRNSSIGSPLANCFFFCRDPKVTLKLHLKEKSKRLRTIETLIAFSLSGPGSWGPRHNNPLKIEPDHYEYTSKYHRVRAVEAFPRFKRLIGSTMGFFKFCITFFQRIELYNWTDM